MRRSFSKADLRHLSLAVAIAVLLVSVPSTAGFVIVSGPSQPQFTINICQPIQMFGRVSNTMLARPATVVPEFVLSYVGSTVVRETPQPADCKVVPDTPPPKRPV
jgi:hypothetical protein